MNERFPVIEPIEREQRLYERVSERILDLIHGGMWEPGDRLPAERDLAQSFGVSRTVVREAVKVLEAQGVLESATGSGVYVREPDSRMVSRSFQTYLQLQDAKDIDIHIAEIRRVLETEIAALAAARATAVQRSDLIAICKEMRRFSGSARTLADLDFQLHLALAFATQNELFGVLLMPLMEQLREFFLIHWDDYGGPTEPVLTQHEALVDAVVAGDAELARQCMTEHLAFSEKLMIKRLQRLGKLA
ncbi:MAG: FadR family transcriptional regulator [Caldilineales bacterium]|nr:FadR family transcriptional regulator [Caldilineales bacterium]